MKELKKGAQSTKENTQTQIDNNILFYICLFNFVLSFVLMIVGKSIDNNVVTALGAGIAFVTLEISLFINREETK